MYLTTLIKILLFEWGHSLSAWINNFRAFGCILRHHQLNFLFALNAQEYKRITRKIQQLFRRYVIQLIMHSPHKEFSNKWSSLCYFSCIAKRIQYLPELARRFNLLLPSACTECCVSWHGGQSIQSFPWHFSISNWQYLYSLNALEKEDRFIEDTCNEERFFITIEGWSKVLLV